MKNSRIELEMSTKDAEVLGSIDVNCKSPLDIRWMRTGHPEDNKTKVTITSDIKNTNEFKEEYQKMVKHMNDKLDMIQEFRLGSYSYIESYQEDSVSIPPKVLDVPICVHIFNYVIVAPNVNNRNYTIKITE